MRAFLISVLLSGLVAVIGCQMNLSPAVSAQPAPAPTTSAPPPDMVTYTNPDYHWSITYPSSYTIDASELEWIKLTASDPPRGIGVHSFQAEMFNSLDEMVDWMLDDDQRYFEGKGLNMVVISRRPITLPNDVAAIDVVKEMQPGGKSRDIYVLIGQWAYLLSAETYVEFWDESAASFDQIINSFAVDATVT